MPPHPPAPFFKASRGVWYAKLGPKQNPLGKHPDGLPPPQKKNGVWQVPPPILTVFYKLMAGAAAEPEPVPVHDPAAQLVVEVFDEFTRMVRQSTKELRLTFVWYRQIAFKAFIRTIDKRTSA